MNPYIPTLRTLINGIAYGFKLATRQEAAHPHNPQAIWQAIWAKFILNMINGGLATGLVNIKVLPFFIAITLIDVFAYPVASHTILNAFNLGKRYTLFITAFLWLGNFRILLLTAIILGSIAVGINNVPILLFPFVIWMIWAMWSVATITIGRGGWVGTGMVILALIIEVVLSLAITSFAAPILTQQ